jgi:CubicO group peptidase (beta-lactamase class C family)
VAFQTARSIVQSGLATRAFPAAVVDVGRESGPIWREPFGRLTYDPGAAPCALDTVFDLASLTKVIATASTTMALVARSQLSLDGTVGDWLEEWRAPGRAGIRIRHLLDHSSGLPAHVRFWEQARDRAEVRRALAALPLEREPGRESVYSDPGFILLGFVLEQAGGASLEDQFKPSGFGGDGPLLYRPGPELIDRTAPTEQDPWRGRVLRGEVHDENAAVLGGVAPHAGLFGTAGAVAAFARLVLRTLRTDTVLGTSALMRQFAARTSVPNSSRALAWDTMRPTSSCGTRMTPTAIGHTGFTGTSLWIDYERDLYVVLLTNRVHPTRDNNQLRQIRPRLHEAILEEPASLPAPSPSPWR